MKHLIDKDALVAEIEKHLSYYKDLKDRGILSKEGEAAYRVVRILKSDINSLEVKEVDLTWEDVSTLRNVMAEYRRQVSNEMTLVNNEEFCKEVLRRFKAQKGEEV